MGLLEKLKSFLGSDGSQARSSSGEAEVTVEREPGAGSEHAVKGTAATSGTDDESDAPAVDDSTASPGEPVEGGEPTPAQGEPAGRSEPAEDVEAVEEQADDREPEAESDAAAAGVDRATEAEAGVESEATEGTAEPSPSVDQVKGIGPTYAGRLGGAGIETVADLAVADAEQVAEAAETSVSRASDWIERAQEHTADE